MATDTTNKDKALAASKAVEAFVSPDHHIMWARPVNDPFIKGYWTVQVTTDLLRFTHIYVTFHDGVATVVTDESGEAVTGRL